MRSVKILKPKGRLADQIILINGDFVVKIKKNEMAFFTAYILYYISLFIRDVSGDNFIVELSRYLRLLSYIIISIQLLLATKLKFKRLIRTAALLALTFAYGLYTKDLYWSILVLFIISSREIDANGILSVSFRIIVFGTVIVVSLGIIGFLPDLINQEGGTSLVQDRHSLGFYHSNVLPLLILYMEIYYIILKRKHPSTLIAVAFGVLSTIVFFLCGSRNALCLSYILTFGVLCQRIVRKRKRIISILNVVSKFIVIFLSAVSIFMMFLVAKGGVWDKIDTIFSGRFRLGLIKMERVGLHFINFMSNDYFFSDSITYVTGKVLDTVVIDNGYLYVILRYGLIAIVFYFVISYLLSNKSKDNYCFTISSIIVFVANFVDNDLVDYCFLPLIFLAFSEYDSRGVNKLIRSSKNEK